MTAVICGHLYRAYDGGHKRSHRTISGVTGHGACAIAHVALSAWRHRRRRRSNDTVLCGRGMPDSHRGRHITRSVTMTVFKSQISATLAAVALAALTASSPVAGQPSPQERGPAMMEPAPSGHAPSR